MSTNKKIVVTGGAGFIGSNLVDAIVGEGYDVHVVDTLVAGKREYVNKKAKLHEVDVRDSEKLKSIFQGAYGVFHLAALPRVQYSIEHPVESNSVNVDGTLSVIKTAHECGLEKIVYAASSSAYGDQEKMPLEENMTASPKSPYGLQKYVGELYMSLACELYGIKTVSLRFFNVYGPRQSDEGAYALVIAKFLKQKKDGTQMTITGDGEQTRDFTHVRDIVRANILAMQSEKVGKGEVINIGAGKAVSVNEIAKIIGGETVHIAPRIETKHTLADNRKAKELLGWEPKESLIDGIKELMT